MPAHGKTSTRTMEQNKQAVLDALAKGMTYQQAADTAGVLVATVTRYAADPVFQQRLRDAQATYTATITRTLTARAAYAIDVLSREMVQGVNPTVRVRAALGLLAEARAWRDTDLDERLTALESQVLTGRTHLRSV